VVVPERDVDPAAVYEAERLAFVSLIGSLPAAELEGNVAATPLWTVRDVLSHVVGITADLNAQQFGNGDGDAWTLAQVTARRDRTVEDLAAEWDREAPVFEVGLRLFGYTFGAHYLGDLLQHVCDVEATIGRSPVRDDVAVVVGLDFYLGSFEEALGAQTVGGVDIRAGRESWRLGTGDAVASLAATPYELFRALGGRRTRDEIAALDWAGDADRFIGLLSRYPMPLASLQEPGVE
jgi:uncharacterized protein (TIGR03083 family)